MKLSEKRVKTILKTCEDVGMTDDDLPALCQDWLAMRDGLKGIIPDDDAVYDIDYPPACFFCGGGELEWIGEDGDIARCLNAECAAVKARRLLEGET